MKKLSHNAGLGLANELIANGKIYFTFSDARRRLGRSAAATGNLLKRMESAGLIDRVRRGHYVVRQLGVLGTPSVAEEVALAVGAAFTGTPHRMGYRTALDEHDLIVHPARSITVATPKQVRTRALSGRPLQIVKEPESHILIGAIPCGSTWVSDRERALLDAATRPKLVGGSAVLAEAIATAENEIDVDKLTHYAKQLNWAAAIRRIGSIADALELQNLANRIRPLKPITSDLDLEPGVTQPLAWRDARWRVRWLQVPDELANVVRQ
ncbi:MAG: type IV toxin-antitoxin system AbiEi family antitoxin domain-containing protein [Halieaceae bacterium]|nr:type IV toxin-antitoxin system AbiEi family antitoxin domain-containing protein [Halieaceae bacterium]